MDLNPLERGHAAALAAVIVWALVPVGTRFFVLRVDPWVFNVVRFAASGGAALPLFVCAKPWAWPVRDKLLLLLCAILAVSGYSIPVALGARTVPAGELGVLIATEPVMIALLTLILHRRPIDSRVIAGSVVALLGVTLTSGIMSAEDPFKWVSTLQVLGGAFSWSCYTVLAVRLNQRYGAFGVTGAILVVGTVVLLIISLPMVDSSMLPDGITMSILAAMGLSSSLLGFILWNFAGAVVPAERLGLYLYLLPLVSVIAGVQFLAESLTVPVILGGGLIVFGVWIASRPGRIASPALIE